MPVIFLLLIGDHIILNSIKISRKIHEQQQFYPIARIKDFVNKHNMYVVCMRVFVCG